MRTLFTVLVLAVAFSACNSGKKTSEIASYSYSKIAKEPTAGVALSIGDFVKKDSIVYGIAMVIDKDGVYQYGKPLKAKVIEVGKDGVKMKALENISLMPKKDCKVFQINKGEIWIEKENELFRTEEEAIAYLKKRNLYIEDD